MTCDVEDCMGEASWEAKGILQGDYRRISLFVCDVHKLLLTGLILKAINLKPRTRNGTLLGTVNGNGLNWQPWLGRYLVL